MTVKINSLELENIKRIKAVKLVPSANGLTILGGKNGQGKTSVLDAIAWALGFLMERIKVPALVGYLLAGIIISPATPGFVGDVNIASELSEIGVMLLMFGVGLHFSLTDLIRVKNIAVPGAILLMGLATCLGAVLAHFWGWPWGQSIVFGMCLSCASTVVLLKGLESRGILELSLIHI